nr:MAG TPA: protein of unknown function (DUF4808) [Caudoviricetes sp.]
MIYWYSIMSLTFNRWGKGYPPKWEYKTFLKR